MRFLLILIILASCGKYESSTNPRMGQLIEYSPQILNESQLAEKKRICDAISKKTDVVRQMHNAPFSFNISESNCQGEASQSEVVEVVLNVSDASIQFARKDNNGYFVFREVETLRSGIFKSYCASDKLPFLHQDGPVWMDVRTSDFCSQESGSTCVNFKIGLKENNSEYYKVSTQEIFKIDTRENSTRYGFYTQRTLESSVGCSSGSRLIKGTLN